MKRSGSNSKNTGAAAIDKRAAAPDRTEYLAVLPGILMCVMIMLMLLLDVTTPGMESKQYTEFQNIFRLLNLVAVAAGASFLLIMCYRSFTGRCTETGKGGRGGRKGSNSKDNAAYRKNTVHPSKGDSMQTAGEHFTNKKHGKSVRQRAASEFQITEKPGLSLTDMRHRLVWLFFGGFLLCILISTAVNGFDEKALHGVPFRNTGVLHLAAYVLVYMGAAAGIRRRELRNLIPNMYLAAADLLAAAVFADRFIAEIPAFHDKKDLSAVFFNGNHYGYFIVMAVLLAAGLFIYGSRRQSVFGAVSLVLNFIVLLMNRSSGCMLAVMTVLAVFAVYVLIRGGGDERRKMLILAGSAVMVLLAGLFMVQPLRAEAASFFSDITSILSGDADSSAGHNRLLLWETVAAYIKERPLTGYGCEGISDLLMAETGRANAHNELLTYAAFYGIPAAVLYTLGVITVIIEGFIEGFRGHDDAAGRSACLAAAAYFISSLFGVTMFYTLPFFFIFMGLSLSSAADPPSA